MILLTFVKHSYLFFFFFTIWVLINGNFLFKDSARFAIRIEKALADIKDLMLAVKQMNQQKNGSKL